MGNEKQELTEQLKKREKELAKLEEQKRNDTVEEDVPKDESRLKDEISDLKRKLKIIEDQKK